MRVDGTFGELIARFEMHSLLGGHAGTIRDRILADIALIRHDRNLAHTLTGIFNVSTALNLSDDSMVLWFTRLEKFLDTWKTLGDIVTGNTAGMERTHGELSTRLTDGLSSNNTDCLANLDLSMVSQIAPIALNADTKLRLTVSTLRMDT